MKTKLLGSAPSLDQLKTGIEKFYCGTEISFNSLSDNSWSVSNDSGVIGGVIVIKKKNRFRFEGIYRMIKCDNQG